MSVGAFLAQAADLGSVAQIQSVWDFVVKGGPMMIPIGLASLAAFTIIIERAITLRRWRVIPPDFLPALSAELDAGKPDAQRALDYCGRNPSPVANIFAAALRRRHEPTELLEKHVERAGEHEVFRLRKHLRALSVIAAISPLMGLLGTIFGMIRAFSTVAASGEALGRTELLARGIYEAMITTAAGLIVTIPVLIAYHWISARIDRLISEIDQMTVEFVEQQRNGVDAASRRAVHSAPVPPITDMEKAEIEATFAAVS